jgi:mercuric reductase
MSEPYDLIVIGAGSAARDAAQTAACDHGARVALVERERWGGSCPNVACTPTKAYLVAAELLHQLEARAPVLGIETGDPRLDLARVRAWKESLKKPEARWVEDLEASGFATFDGTATFVVPNTVRVDEQELTAERILIATGSRTAVPPIEGLDGIDWLDHVSALELTEVPESLLVVGGGAVGLEFGQAFSRFGSRVTIVDALGQIAPRADGDAAAELRAALEDEGIEFVLGSLVRRVAPARGGIEAWISPVGGGEERQLSVSRLLLASGRVPNVEELELEAIGVETSRAGIVVDGRMRTSVDGVWAAGDVNGLAPFTPVAQYQARIAVEDMFGDGDGPEADYAVLPTAIFTDPELASVGLTLATADEQGLDAEAATHPLRAVRRASYYGATRGLFRLVFERASRRVLGIHVVAPNASEVVQALSVALRLGVTVDELARAHHTFPTIGEGIKAAAEQAQRVRVGR